MKKFLPLMIAAVVVTAAFSSAYAANNPAYYVQSHCPATYEGKKLSDVDFQFNEPNPQLNFTLCWYGSDNHGVNGPYYTGATAFEPNTSKPTFVPGNWKQEDSNFADCATNGNPADCEFLRKLVG